MWGVLTRGLPKQLGSANPMSSMKITTIFGFLLLGSAAETHSRPAETATRERMAIAYRFIAMEFVFL